MTTPVEKSLLHLHEKMLPDHQPLSETSSTGSWQGRAVKKPKGFGQEFILLLKTIFIREKKENQSIKHYQFIRSTLSAGFLNRDYSVTNNLSQDQIAACNEKARELWCKNPFEYANWCIENQQPFPEHFIMTELIPWQAEEYCEFGMDRKRAADLALNLCLELQLITLTPDQSSLEVQLNTLTPDRPSLDIHQNETAEDYLNSFTPPLLNSFNPAPFSSQEKIKIELLQSCWLELKSNWKSRKNTSSELLNKVLMDNPGIDLIKL